MKNTEDPEMNGLKYWSPERALWFSTQQRTTWQAYIEHRSKETGRFPIQMHEAHTKNVVAPDHLPPTNPGEHSSEQSKWRGQMKKLELDMRYTCNEDRQRRSLCYGIGVEARGEEKQHGGEWLGKKDLQLGGSHGWLSELQQHIKVGGKRMSKPWVLWHGEI